MLDSETVIRTPHDASDSRTSVSMKTRGVELLLFFDDLSGEGPVRELRLLPDTVALEPAVLRQIALQIPLFVSYSRAAIQMRDEDTRSAARALREIGATRRGLGEDFYKIIAAHYTALVSEGERHPIKALSVAHHVTISSASRWVAEARRRGLIEDRKERS